MSALGHPSRACPPRGGAGSARPEGGHRLDRGMCPLGHRLIVNPSAANGMPRHSWGLATRTHRVRPSEKTACRALFGSAPVRPSRLRLAIPRRGGLRTPASEASLSPRDGPIRPPGFRLPPNDYVMPRLASGLTTRTRRPRPSEKISFRVNSRLSPLGHPSSDSPHLEGRAPHARNDGITPTPTSPPPGHRLIVNPSAANGMPRHSWGLATRTHGVRPSEKTTHRAIPGPSSARPSHPG